MTMTIELPPEVEVRLKDAAAQQGMDIKEFIRVALESKLRETPPDVSARRNSETLDVICPRVNADNSVLEPLPVLEGYVPPGWKDAVYSKS